MIKKKLKKRFSEINEAIAEVEKITSLPDEKFWSKKEYMAAVKYYLLQAIEAVDSVCVHIAAKKFNKGVSAFGECFEILEEENFLDKDLTIRLRQMVKFRNKLVHQYWKVDDKAVLEYARNNLEDFNEFMRKVENLF